MPSLLQRLKRLAPVISESRSGVLVAFLAAVVIAASEPAIPALMNQLLDQGFAKGELALWMVPVAIIGLFALRSAATFIAQYGLAWTANCGVLRLRERMFERLLRAEPSLLARSTASQLSNTVVYEGHTGLTLIVNCLLTLVRDSLTLVALLVYLLLLNWQLTLVVGLLFPAVGVVMRALGRRLHRLHIEGQKSTDQLAYVVEENLLAWRIVRLHGIESQQQARFGSLAGSMRRLTMKTVAAGATMTPVTQMLAACALSGVITAALWQSSSGQATVGGFVAFVTAMLMLIAPIKHLSDVMAPLMRGLSAFERALDFAEQSPTEQGGAHRVERARGEIRFENVVLRYRDDAALALDGVELTVEPGRSVALVGPSGAGKTTLVNLLPRFVHASSGRVLLDGVPLPEWDLACLRRQFALVSQDVVLFNDTLAHNVSLGTPMTEVQVRAALEAAHLLAFADALPQGIHTPIGHNGSQLSGGQRQRLAIARAIAKDAPLLILDEATSALDSESERAVQAALQTLMRGRTTLVIAHRLSTIENADRVVAMEAGRVVEQGTHAELLARGGLYARLHAMQFKT